MLITPVVAALILLKKKKKNVNKKFTNVWSNLEYYKICVVLIHDKT